MFAAIVCEEGNSIDILEERNSNSVLLRTVDDVLNLLWALRNGLSELLGRLFQRHAVSDVDPRLVVAFLQSNSSL